MGWATGHAQTNSAPRRQRCYLSFPAALGKRADVGLLSRNTLRPRRDKPPCGPCGDAADSIRPFHASSRIGVASAETLWTDRTILISSHQQPQGGARVCLHASQCLYRDIHQGSSRATASQRPQQHTTEINDRQDHPVRASWCPFMSMNAMHGTHQ